MMPQFYYKSYMLSETDYRYSNTILAISCAYFFINTVFHFKQKQENEAFVTILSYITLITNLQMMMLTQEQIHIARLTLWMFTVPIQFYIIGDILHVNVASSIVMFNASVVLKMMTDFFEVCNHGVFHVLTVCLGMGSIAKICRSNGSSIQTKYVTIFLWTSYAILHMLFTMDYIHIQYMNITHSLLDLFMKAFLTSYIIHYNDTVYSISACYKSMDDIRALIRIYDIVKQSTFEQSKLMYYIRNLIGASIESIEANTDLKNNIINTVFFGNSFQELIKTGSYAREYECAGILFIDIINYTQMCKSMTPSDLTEYMNLVYTMYDETLREFPILLKIETIGDAYMVVSGAHNLKHIDTTIDPREHLQALFNFAKCIIKRLPYLNTKLHVPLAVRAGINCGPVSVSIVGIDVPRCCFFGHTVNVAARVQNAADRNCIAVTEEAFSQLDMDSSHIARIVEDLKGIGETVVYKIGDGNLESKS